MVVETELVWVGGGGGREEGTRGIAEAEMTGWLCFILSSCPPWLLASTYLSAKVRGTHFGGVP